MTLLSLLSRSSKIKHNFDFVTKTMLKFLEEVGGVEDSNIFPVGDVDVLGKV